MEEKYKVGDKVYFIRNFRDIYYKGYDSRQPTTYPFEKKITQVVHTKNGNVMYQVKGGHFDNSWIGKIVFNSMEEAKKAIINK